MSLDGCLDERELNSGQAVVFMRSEGNRRAYFARVPDGRDNEMASSPELDQLAYWLAEEPTVTEPVNGNNFFSDGEYIESGLSESDFSELNDRFNQYRERFRTFRTY